MKGKKLITCFSFSSLLNATIIMMGINSLNLQEVLFIRRYLFQSELVNGIFVLFLQFLAMILAFLLYRLNKAGRAGWDNRLIEKSMQLAMGVIYLVSVSNLVQIGLTLTMIG